MSEKTDISDLIETEAAESQSVSVDGMSVSKRSIPDLIAADKHLSRKRGNRFGFGLAKLKAPEHF